MELTRKIIISITLILILICTGCVSSPLETQEDPLVLLELTPLPKTVKKQEKVIYEPIYGIMRVLEISTENGVQTQLMAKKGDVKEGLDKGVVGDIAEDSSFGEIIGTFKIVSVANGFVTGKIESVTKKIPNNAYIRVITGQKIKED